MRPDGGSATGVVVGLTGKWGEGKTSILELLRCDLRERFPKTVVVEFSPWLVSQRHDLLRAFFQELDRSLADHLSQPIHGNRKSQAVEELSSAIADYLERVAPVLELIEQGSGTALKLGVKVLKVFSQIYRNHRAEDEQLAKLKARVEELLAELEVPVIVLVDEVDRIDDRDIRELMHLVKAVADFPSISYILAYDEIRVAEALGFEAPLARDRVVRGRRYLEKIVQVPIPLPIIFNEELERLLDEGVEEVLGQEKIPQGRVSQQRYQELKKILIPQILSTVRDVRRLASSFAHRLSLMSGEVEWPDVLGFIALNMCAPGLSAQVRSTPEEFVFDGALSVHINLQDYDDRFASLTERRERNSNVKALFGFLFPALSKLRSQTDCLLDDVAFRRPLLTLLRMKVLSSMVGRADVIYVTGLKGTELANAIARIVDDGKGSAFAERLADLASNNVVPIGEETWIALLLAIDEVPLEGNWPRALVRKLALREVVDTLLSFVGRPDVAAVDLRKIVEEVSRSDAFEAASLLIRQISLRRTRGGTLFEIAIEKAGVGEAWLKTVGDEVVRRAKDYSLRTKTLLHVATVFLAEKVGQWDASDKEHYAALLSSDDKALDLFVIEAFGGHYSTDGSTIERLFMPLGDFKVRVSKRLSQMGKDTDLERRQAYDKAYEWFDMQGVDDMQDDQSDLDDAPGQPDSGRV